MVSTIHFERKTELLKVLEEWENGWVNRNIPKYVNYIYNLSAQVTMHVVSLTNPIDNL